MPTGWFWLFPLTYLLHILEEALAAEGFYRWIGRVAGRRMTLPAFLILNAIFFGLMVTAALAAASGSFPVLIPALGIITLVNGLGHLAGSLWTRSYSPGLLTGMLLWAPLGATALALSAKYLSFPTVAFGIALGFLASGSVLFLGFVASRPAPPS